MGTWTAGYPASPAPYAAAAYGAYGGAAVAAASALPPPQTVTSIRDACEQAGRGVSSGHTVEDLDITVYGPDERPVQPYKYEGFDQVQEFPREILNEFRKAGFPGPSQIQAYTWPLALQGKDVIGIAATGSGKTLAFLLPAFVEMKRVGHRPDRQGPGCLVMSPTRELAQQTETEANRFGNCIGMHCVAMYGGAPKKDQLWQYRKGCHTVVACPGRLNDFLDGGQVRLDAVMKLVLDEADRMLDMGFEPQIRKIMEKLPRQRHTLFFTATWPKEVRKLASEILYYPYKVMIGNRDVLKGNQDVIQQVRVIDGRDKDRALLDVIREAGLGYPNSCGKALVFANTKRLCEDLSRNLYRNGISCQSIHGDKDQKQRDEALNGLKTGKIKVLVATDVAARGLDIKGVGLVVNYDAANNTEDYVHRIGRTGRAGAKGYAVTFMTRQDSGKARGLMEVMERTNQEIPRELRDMAGYGGGGERRDRWGGSRGGSSGSYGGSRGSSGGGKFDSWKKPESSQKWGSSSWDKSKSSWSGGGSSPTGGSKSWSGGGGGGGGGGGWSDVNSIPLGTPAPARDRSRSPRR